MDDPQRELEARYLAATDPRGGSGFRGDADRWSPPRRFDFVRSELIYVSEAEQPALVARLLTDHALLGRWGHNVVGVVVGRDPDGLVLTNVAWVDAAR